MMGTKLSFILTISFFCICNAYMPHDLISKVTNRTGVDVIAWQKCKDTTTTITTDCLSCGVQVTCLHDDGTSAVAFTEECLAGESCNTVCQQGTPLAECACASNSDIKLDTTTDSTDKSWYIDCSDKNGNYYKKCENGYFDETIPDCITCPQNGRIIRKENCQEYITCKKSNDDLFIESGKESCPDGKFVSDISMACVDRIGSFTCIEPGRFEDPFDCHRYQECDDEAVQNLNQSTPNCCSTGKMYDKETKTCVTGECEHPEPEECPESISALYCPS